MCELLKKIKTEPNDWADYGYKPVKVKKEPIDTSFCKSVKIKKEPNDSTTSFNTVRVKTEPGVKVKSEPVVKVKSEPVDTTRNQRIKRELVDEKQSISSSGATDRTPVKRKPATKRKSTTTRRKVTRRRRTTKVGKKRKVRRKKRRTKKSRVVSRALPSADARTRITAKLGIGRPPKSPHGLPTLKNNLTDTASTADLRAAAGISHLSLFGTELATYDPPVLVEEKLTEATDKKGDNVCLSARKRFKQEHRLTPVKQEFVKIKQEVISQVKVKQEPFIASNQNIVNNSSLDLLGEIMQSQTKLHSSSRDLTITRDGSVLLKTDSLAKPNSIFRK